MLCEIVGDVVDHLGDLIDPKVSIMAMLWEEGDWGGLRALSIRSTRNILNNRRTLSTLITLSILSTLITLRALSTLSAFGGWGVLSILVHGDALSSQIHFLAEFGDFHAVPTHFV